MVHSKKFLFLFSKRKVSFFKKKKGLAVWRSLLVGDERIELPQVESESTALPLCKSPSDFDFLSGGESFALPTVIIILRLDGIVNPQNKKSGIFFRAGCVE